MLIKLIKHELKATARICLPLFLAVTFLAVLANVSGRYLAEADSAALNMVGVAIVFIFGICVTGLAFAMIALMAMRFKNNILSDEGYLMLTLPVSLHSILWSKILVSLLWFLCTGFALGLAGILSVLGFEDFFDAIRFLWDNLSSLFNIEFDAVLFLLEMFMLFVVGGTALCLMFYASISVGYSFAKWKKLLSTLTFFLLWFILQLGFVYIMEPLIENISLATMSDVDSVVHAIPISGSIVSAIAAVLFYAITVLFIKRRLNLE